MGPLAFALGIGFVSGLRSFTAPAAVSWAACYGWLNLQGTPLQFMSSGVTVAILTVLALAEYVADKLPRTPNRTNAGPLIGRIVLGGLSAAALVLSAQGSALMGALLGGIGAVIGAFTGYAARRRAVAGLGGKDFYVAIGEDLVAIALAGLIVSATASHSL